MLLRYRVLFYAYIVIMLIYSGLSLLSKNSDTTLVQALYTYKVSVCDDIL